MNRSNKLYIISAVSVCLFTFVLSLILVNNTKTTYAIETGIFSNGFPTNTFTTNVDSSAVDVQNLVKDSFGTDTSYANYFKNFNVLFKQGTNYLDNNNTNPLYQLLKNLEAPKATEQFQLKDGAVTNINDKGLTYIINHGYNITNNTNTIFTPKTYGDVTNNRIKQYITQIALWLYIYENKSSYTSTYCKPTGQKNGTYEIAACDFLDYSSTVPSQLSATTVREVLNSASTKTGYNYLKYITALVDKAKAYTGAQNSAIADIGSYNYSFSTDNKKAYIYNITPSISGNSENYMHYAVEITDPNAYGVYIADNSGNKITNTTNMSGSFSVVIPLKTDVTTMNLKTVKIKIYGYFIVDSNRTYVVTDSTSEPLDGLSNNLVVKYDGEKRDRYSSVILGYAPYEVISKEISLSNFTKISKVDATNGNELPGATLVVTNKNDSTKTWTWVSTNQPHYLSLEDGTYSLCETIAPTGYDKQTECIEFTVVANRVNAVTMENQPTHIPDTSKVLNKILLYGGLLITIVGIGIISYIMFNKKVTNE